MVFKNNVHIYRYVWKLVQPIVSYVQQQTKQPAEVLSPGHPSPEELNINSRTTTDCSKLCNITAQINPSIQKYTSLRRSSWDHSIDAGHSPSPGNIGHLCPGCSKWQISASSSILAAHCCCCRLMGQTDRWTPEHYTDAYYIHTTQLASIKGAGCFYSTSSFLTH